MTSEQLHSCGCPGGYARRRVACPRGAGRGLAGLAVALVVLVLAGPPALAQTRPAGRDSTHPFRHEPFPRSGIQTPPGRWLRARDAGDTTKLTDEQKREIERLSTIGYLGGYKPAPAQSGVTVHDRERAQAGYNLYTSGHSPVAILMDMDGNVVHEWRHRFLDAWPDERALARLEPDRLNRWRYAYPLEGGDLLAIFEGAGLIRVDRDSELVWKYLGGCHHDLKVQDDGTIYVLAREAHVVPRINPDRPILEDFIAVLDADGNELRRFSVLEAFECSAYADTLAALGMKDFGDIFHTNAIEVLDGRIADREPAFREGNILISIRRLDLIAVVDPDLEEIVWVRTGPWRAQHDPTVLPNGNILLFDNLGHGGQSKVIEFDPVTGEIHWLYAGNETDAFFTKAGGACQRLPNGNTLITESDNGRAFEVTPDGEIVWEYRNPERAGEDDELIATIFEMIRLPADTPLDWLPDR